MEPPLPAPDDDLLGPSRDLSRLGTPRLTKSSSEGRARHGVSPSPSRLHTPPGRPSPSGSTSRSRSRAYSSSSTHGFQSSLDHAGGSSNSNEQHARSQSRGPRTGGRTHDEALWDASEGGRDADLKALLKTGEAEVNAGDKVGGRKRGRAGGRCRSVPHAPCGGRHADTAIFPSSHTSPLCSARCDARSPNSTAVRRSCGPRSTGTTRRPRSSWIAGPSQTSPARCVRTQHRRFARLGRCSDGRRQVSPTHPLRPTASATPAQDGYTALMRAAVNGHGPVSKVLIKGVSQTCLGQWRASERASVRS